MRGSDVTDEVAEAAPTPAPGAPASKTPPRTIVIIDESLASHQAEKAATEQAESDRTAADDWAVDDAGADAAGAEPTAKSAANSDNLIVIVDDSVYDDDFVLDNGTTAEAVIGSDDVIVPDHGLSNRGTAAVDAGVSAETPVAPVMGSDDTAGPIVADLGPGPVGAGVSAETPVAPDISVGAEAEDDAGAGAEDEAAGLSQAAPLDADGLPVPTYDSLSLPSLRARLRNLDIDQVRMLADYERAHAARADVITMFERRIDKLAAQQ